MPLFKGKFEVPDKLLNDLRSRFLEEIDSGPEEAAKYHPDDVARVKENDWFIARYLLHHELSTDNAFKMLKKSLMFRHEMDVNTLKREDIPSYYFDARTVQIYNQGKNGLPILAIRGKAHKKNTEETRLHQQYMLYWVEKAVKLRDWGSVIVLFDCTDAGYKNLDMELTKFILATFHQYYPWTMNVFMVYNMPWYMSAIWKLIKSWIPEKHLSRVVLLNNDSIFQYIDKDQLPVCMGGTCTDQYDSKDVEEPAKGWF